MIRIEAHGYHQDQERNARKIMINISSARNKNPRQILRQEPDQHKFIPGIPRMAVYVPAPVIFPDLIALFAKPETDDDAPINSKSTTAVAEESTETEPIAIYVYPNPAEDERQGR